MREALQTLVTALTAGEKWPVYLSDAIVDARAVLRDVEVPLVSAVAAFWWIVP
jgi:hypothetical protein